MLYFWYLLLHPLVLNGEKFQLVLFILNLILSIFLMLLGLFWFIEKFWAC